MLSCHYKKGRKIHVKPLTEKLPFCRRNSFIRTKLNFTSTLLLLRNFCHKTLFQTFGKPTQVDTGISMGPRENINASSTLQLLN